MRIIREDNNENKYYNLPRILSSDIKNKINTKKLENEFELSNRFVRHQEEEFFDFFQSFTSAQARLIRLQEDSRFLLWLIQTMIEYESKKPNTLPYIRKIAEDVIIYKTISYQDVKEKSSSALSEAQYFVDFDSVMSNIMNRWGIDK